MKANREKSQKMRNVKCGKRHSKLSAESSRSEGTWELVDAAQKHQVELQLLRSSFSVRRSMGRS